MIYAMFSSSEFVSNVAYIYDDHNNHICMYGEVPHRVGQFSLYHQRVVFVVVTIIRV